MRLQPYAMIAVHCTRFILTLILTVNNNWPGERRAQPGLLPLDGDVKSAASSVSLNGARRYSHSEDRRTPFVSQPTKPTANALAGLAVIPFALRGPYRVKSFIETPRREPDAVGWGYKPAPLLLGSTPRELMLSFEKLGACRLQTLR